MTADFDVLIRLMKERRSERQFLPDALSPAVVDRLLEVASSAPSASNRQPYRFMVVSRRETITKMADVVRAELRQREPPTALRSWVDPDEYAKNFLVFENAPVVIVVFVRANDALQRAVVASPSGDPVAEGRESLSSAAAFIMQLLLLAHAAEFNACWMTGPCVAEHGLLELLEVPRGLRIAALVPIGGRAAQSVAPKRRSVEKLRLTEPVPTDTGSKPSHSEG